MLKICIPHYLQWQDIFIMSVNLSRTNIIQIDKKQQQLKKMNTRMENNYIFIYEEMPVKLKTIL